MARSAVDVTGEHRYEFKFQKIPIVTLVMLMSRLANRTYAVDPEVHDLHNKGRFSNSFDGKMTVAEADRVFLTLLEAHGYTTVPYCECFKIIPCSKGDGKGPSPYLKPAHPEISYNVEIVISRDGENDALIIKEVKRENIERSVKRYRRPRIHKITLRKKVIDDAARDIAKLRTQAKFTPKIGDDGKLEGLSISDVKHNSIFRHMKFRNHDVLKNIDGQPVQSGDDALKLIKMLSSADCATLKIKRRGRDFTFEYSIATLNILRAAVGKERKQPIAFDFYRIQLIELAHVMKNITGREFFFDGLLKVKGRATIKTPFKVTIAETERIFAKILEAHGYTTVPHRKLTKIVPVAEAESKSLKNRLKTYNPEKEYTVTVWLTRDGGDKDLKIKDIRMEEDKCGSKGGRRVGKQRVLIKRKTYAYAAKDVSELMTRFDFRPKIGDDGKPEGMIISNVKPNAIIIRRMGLRNGDMVKSFEGQKVHSRDDLMKLFESLKSAHSLYVQIQRRGIDHTLKYDIR